MTTLRADAERNRERVLDHATRLLAHDPAVGVGDIAHAAGVGRATLYRHFPTREDLLTAIDERAFYETEAAFAASRLAEGTAAAALERLVAAVLEVGDRYRFLLGDDTVKRDPKRDERFTAPLFALIERGQAAGEFSRTMAPRWMLAVLGAVIVAAVREIADGRLERESAPAVVTDTLLHAYAPLRSMT
jgi:TetR/AcrR family transcriptional regulator, mexCD-oprJ operon repressor